MKDDLKKIKEEARERTLGYVLGGLGLVAGLAWNEAIKQLIEYVFPIGKNTLLAKFIYAILITIIVVVLSTYLVKFLGKKENLPSS